MFLFVAMLRMAHIFLFPSTLYTESNIMKVVTTMQQSYAALEATIIFAVTTQQRIENGIEIMTSIFVQLIDELFFSLIPFVITYVALLIWGRS